MRRFSGEFKVTLVVVVLVMVGVSTKLLSEAGRVEPRSEFISDEVHVTYDVEYGNVDGKSGRLPLLLDVYQPRSWSSKLRPALLLIHGGGWIEGDKAGERDLASILVPQGYVAFAVNYRLCVVDSDQNRFPTALLDVRRAVRWIRAHASEYGIDPERLGAVGLSAGGHLAAILGTTDEFDPADPNSGVESSRVACVVDTAGPTDFTDDANPPVGESIARVIPICFGRPRAQIPHAYHDASPALLADSRAAPTLIVHGTADAVVPVGQSRRFEQALKAVGVPVKLVELPDEGHGINRPDYRQRWLAEMSAWLAAHLRS